ncbi:GNAT family N-acetyltransferase [Flavobacterium sp. ZT3R18]|uniref:GNAT family N-acetyltransferase n=1 Tax=Flavobacterium sp. ZT3R18 TaxID=2594429 RepID=UPI00117BCE07|nr:GNAT family N-acetyltransferase [Flavobacterium sp. ZT3R18]TRX36829.1 GNAT family N-acetyltransferase [Flavobacterium sp. ZT3R18]
MIYKEVLFNEFIIRNATPEDAVQMEYVQQQCYPTLDPTELLNRNHFINHIKVFPEGQIVLERDGVIVGSASTFRCNFPTQEATFLESSDNLWITNAHVADGEWMYGIDMGILPEYRGLGLSKEMYTVRQEICKKLRLKGQLIAGMTIGYGKVKDKMTIEEYCYALEIKKFTDPTVTPQKKAGFRWIKPLYNHINDPEAGFACIFMYYPVDEDYKLKC